MVTLSVIVPALNEGKVIERTLSRIEMIPGSELLVVDGGSFDETVQVAKRFAKVLSAEGGRGRQLNAGAQAGVGEILLFLHADSCLPPMGLTQVVEAMRDENVVGGAFRLGIASNHLGLRCVATFANWRTWMTKIPYGDQALFVRRKTFDQLNGFLEIPILEDFDFSRRLKQKGQVVILPSKVMTSPRRWNSEGILYVTIRNQLLLLFYLLGVSPSRLASWYRRVR